MADVVMNSTHKKMPKRLAWGLLIGCVSWMGPYSGMNGTLLPAKIGMLDPVNKVKLVATFAAIAMIVAMFANLIEGALSDRTRSRFGKRKPWIIGGTIGSVLMFFVLSWSPTIPILLVTWTIYQLTLNAIVAPMVAIIADAIDPMYRGTVSSFYGIGMSIGAYGSGVVAAQFLSKVNIGIWVFALVQVVLTVIAMILIKEPSSAGEPRIPLKGKELFASFAFPVKNARDFYLALLGKFLMMVGSYMITGYQLYILTDYMRLSQSTTSRMVAIISMILMTTAIVFGAVSGPLADKIGRLKAPVALATLMIAVAGLFPFFDAEPWTMLVYAVLSGIGNGAYLAVDQALNIAVLPNPQTAAKDLGVMNLSATLGQIMGPVTAGAVISLAGYRLIFPVMALICLIGCVMIMCIKKVK
ncbi:MFS transporter [Levilactobacillus tujiorum]|uniref:MFS transporter n=1 Tax=Levilactobacillus tujiorum TaxID=2912243 RepID=A0ABX1L6J0_9LACO|nr:MFS transporter [Levilactobacillus tujiorum]MCH5463728.1 MFS transporter [Levilactobacillus tujiorum]NLR10935.1 MFS transporter [Lactobacillus sp. HBUAS51387]NLR28715.1 MFS transporter [Levilactobacillus tujiorum]